MLNITSLEVEIAVERRKLHSKMFDIAGDSTDVFVFY